MDKNNIFYINTKRLDANFEEYRKLASVCYPIKANSAKQVLLKLKPLIENGGGYFSVSSFNHFENLLKYKISSENVCLINVLCKDEIIKKLYHEGVRFFTFDNIDKLKTFLLYADDLYTKLCFRLNISEVFKEQSHLGCKVDEIKQMIKLAKERMVGISFYLPGKLKSKKSSLRKMLNFIYKNFNNEIDFISIAGIKQPQSIDKEFLNFIRDKMKLKNLYLEPGQFLLEKTMRLETDILRFIDGRHKMLVIQNGLFSGFLDKLIFNKKYQFYLKNKEKVYPIFQKRGLNRVSIDFYGGSGDCSDFLGKYYIDREICKMINQDSKIIIDNIGAYFEEFYMPHGGDIKTEYLINDKGENYEI